MSAEAPSTRRTRTSGGGAGTRGLRINQAGEIVSPVGSGSPSALSNNHHSTLNDYSMSLSELQAPQVYASGHHQASNGSTGLVRKPSKEPPAKKSPKTRRAARMAAAATEVLQNSAGSHHSRRSQRSLRTTNLGALKAAPRLDGEDDEGEGASDASSSDENDDGGSEPKHSRRSGSPHTHSTRKRSGEASSEISEDLSDSKHSQGRSARAAARINNRRLNGSSHHNSTGAIPSTTSSSSPTTLHSKHHHSTSAITSRRSASHSPHRQRERIQGIRTSQQRTSRSKSPHHISSTTKQKVRIAKGTVIKDEEDKKKKHLATPASPQETSEHAKPPVSQRTQSSTDDSIYLTTDDDEPIEISDDENSTQKQAKEYLKNKIQEVEDSDDNESVYSASERPPREMTIFEMRQAFQRDFPGVPLPADEALRDRYTIPGSPEAQAGLQRKGSKTKYMEGDSMHGASSHTNASKYSDRINATPVEPQKKTVGEAMETKGKRVPVPIPWLEKKDSDDKEAAPPELEKDGAHKSSTTSKVKKFLRKSVMAGGGGRHHDSNNSATKSPSGATPRTKRSSVMGMLASRVKAGAASDSNLESPVERPGDDDGDNSSDGQSLDLKRKASIDSVKSQSREADNESPRTEAKFVNTDGDSPGTPGRKGRGKAISKFASKVASRTSKVSKSALAAIKNLAQNEDENDDEKSAGSGIDNDKLEQTPGQRMEEKQLKKLEKEKRRQERELRKSVKKQEKIEKKLAKNEQKENQFKQTHLKDSAEKLADDFEESHEGLMELSGKVDEMYSPNPVHGSPSKKSKKKAFSSALSRVSRMIHTPKKSPKDLSNGNEEGTSAIEEDMKRALSELPYVEELDDEDASKPDGGETKLLQPPSQQTIDSEDISQNRAGSQLVLDDHEPEYGEMALKGDDSGRSRSRRTGRCSGRSKSPKGSSDKKKRSSRSTSPSEKKEGPSRSNSPRRKGDKKGRSSRSRSPKSGGDKKKRSSRSKSPKSSVDKKTRESRSRSPRSSGEKKDRSRSSSRSSTSSRSSKRRSRSSISTKRSSSKAEDAGHVSSRRSSRKSSRSSSDRRSGSSRRSASPSMLRGYKESKRDSKKRAERKKEKDLSLSPGVLRIGGSKRPSRKARSDNESYNSTKLETPLSDGSSDGNIETHGHDSIGTALTTASAVTVGTKISRVKFAPLNNIHNQDDSEGSDFNEAEFENVEKMQKMPTSPGAVKKILKKSELQRARERERLFSDETQEDIDDDGKLFADRLMARKQLPARSTSNQSSYSTDLEDLLEKVTEKALDLKERERDRRRSDRSTASAASKTSRTARTSRTAPVLKDVAEQESSESSNELEDLLMKVKGKVANRKSKRESSDRSAASSASRTVASHTSRKSAPPTMFRSGQPMQFKTKTKSKTQTSSSRTSGREERRKQIEESMNQSMGGILEEEEED